MENRRKSVGKTVKKGKKTSSKKSKNSDVDEEALLKEMYDMIVEKTDLTEEEVALESPL